MIRLMLLAAFLAMTGASCTTVPPDDLNDRKRTPSWSDAIVTGGTVRGSGGD